LPVIKHYESIATVHKVNLHNLNSFAKSLVGISLHISRTVFVEPETGF
jgi:hypothetical protein